MTLSPSPAWTADERLAAIAQVAQRLKDLARTQRYPGDLDDLYEGASAVLLLAVQPAAFLEANRVQLLSVINEAYPHTGASDAP